MSTDHESLSVLVVYSPKARTIVQRSLVLPPGSTVAQALEACDLAATYPEVAQLNYGIWSRPVPLHQSLQTGDRIEIYRGLTVDPKTARRERFKQQGSRAAGLFARRRPGAKAGY
jgi:putative ubiquitin-RnfH superfamily antitoxin RatB of RatAB toxin-antitoxin module